MPTYSNPDFFTYVALRTVTRLRNALPQAIQLTLRNEIDRTVEPFLLLADEVLPNSRRSRDLGSDSFTDYVHLLANKGYVKIQTARLADESPVLVEVAPVTGSGLGGTAVTLTGYGFTDAESVTFGGMSATNVVVVDDHTITCDSPAGGPGAVDVVVMVNGQASNAVSFTYEFARPLTDLTFLVKAYPDGALTLSGSEPKDVTAYAAEVGGISLTAEFVTAYWKRQLAAFDGFNVTEDNAGQFCNYRSPAGASGELKAFFTSDGSNNCAAGSLVGVWQPNAVGDSFFSGRTLANLEIRCDSHSGQDKLVFGLRNVGGGMEYVRVPVTLGQMLAFVARWTATHIYLSVNGGAEVSLALAATGGCSNMNSAFEMFGDSGSGENCDGRFLEFGFIDQSVDASYRAALWNYWNQEYPSIGITV